VRASRGARPGRAAALAAIAAAALLPAALRAAPPEHAHEPGAYCPLPEKGEVPRCLDPAQQAYGSFFEALDRSDPESEDAALATVEEAVARGPEDARAYLALSSLSYGYYRLAQRAAASEGEDPEIARRLMRWNDLLARAYRMSPDDEPYRDAVREAARDLSVRAPVRLPCRDAEGQESECESTEDVLRGLGAASDEAGIRGALERLLRRILGEGGS
jgi:hypothetical protein